MTSAVDKVIVNNPKNVQTNLFLVEQTPSAERIDSFTDESTGFNPYSSWNNNYKAAFELRETWPGWMSSAGASIDSACRLRTNLKTAAIRNTFSMTQRVRCGRKCCRRRGEGYYGCGRRSDTDGATQSYL